jgi:hypothetical protein
MVPANKTTSREGPQPNKRSSIEESRLIGVRCDVAFTHGANNHIIEMINSDLFIEQAPGSGLGHRLMNMLFSIDREADHDCVT